MFTGIVEATGRILERRTDGITVERPGIFDDLAVGASINVAGVCLTIVACDNDAMRFDVVPETWSKTTLTHKKEGDRVNLERAMSAGSRFDGHVVQGHVEGTATVASLHDGALAIDVPDDLLPAITPKGSIAIDGVSLTIASLEGNTVRIALIPHTAEITTLGSLKTGDRVNIETDILLRWAAHAHRTHHTAA